MLGAAGMPSGARQIGEAGPIGRPMLRPRCATAMIEARAKFSAIAGAFAFAVGLPGVGHAAETPVSVALLDLDSGTPDPQGS